MLDVLHVMFEDDMTPRWEQDADIKSKIRSTLYQSMYKKKYKYALNSSARSAEWDTGSDYDDGYESDPLYAAPVDGAVKPYFPPSSPEELESILGMPVGE